MNTEDENLKLFLQIKFNKQIKDINDEDIKSIKEITIDSKKINGEKNLTDLNLLKRMNSLESISINNFVIVNELLQFILFNSNIKKINFCNCIFKENIDYTVFNNIESLILRKTNVISYNELLSSLTNVKDIQIYSQYDDNKIDINLLNDKLEVIILDDCDLTNIKSIIKCSNCKILSLYNSNFDTDNLDFLLKMNNLQEVIIPNKNLITKETNITINDNYQIYINDNY